MLKSCLTPPTLSERRCFDNQAVQYALKAQLCRSESFQGQRTRIRHFTVTGGASTSQAAQGVILKIVPLR